MKVLGTVLIVLILLTIAWKILIPSEPEKKYSNVTAMYPTTSLNIRKGPNTNYSVLKTVNVNTRLLVSDSLSNGFAMVLNEDSTEYGWASKTYLRKNPVKATLAQKSSEQIGLSEETRKEIFYAIVVAQDKAQVEADKKFITDAFDPKYKQSNIEKNIDLYRELEKKYVDGIEKKYNLKPDIINSIKVEGAKNGWPIPELTGK